MAGASSSSSSAGGSSLREHKKAIKDSLKQKDKWEEKVNSTLREIVPKGYGAGYKKADITMPTKAEQRQLNKKHAAKNKEAKGDSFVSFDDLLEEEYMLKTASGKSVKLRFLDWPNCQKQAYKGHYDAETKDWRGGQINPYEKALKCLRVACRHFQSDATVSSSKFPTKVGEEGAAKKGQQYKYHPDQDLSRVRDALVRIVYCGESPNSITANLSARNVAGASYDQIKPSDIRLEDYDLENIKEEDVVSATKSIQLPSVVRPGVYHGQKARATFGVNERGTNLSKGLEFHQPTVKAPNFCYFMGKYLRQRGLSHAITAFGVNLNIDCSIHTDGRNAGLSTCVAAGSFSSQEGKLLVADERGQELRYVTEDSNVTNCVGISTPSFSTKFSLAWNISFSVVIFIFHISLTNF